VKQLSQGDSRVTNVRQGIVLGEDANCWLTATPFGNECRQHVRNTALEAKAFALKDSRQKLSRLRLPQCNIRVIPQLLRNVRNLCLQGFDLLDDLLLLAEMAASALAG